MKAATELQNIISVEQAEKCRNHFEE